MSFSKDASSFRAGDVVLDRYRITGTLGRGGYGAVYAAEHLGTQQALALKMLSVDPSTTHDDVVARFYREARITAGLTDVHTVRVFDVGQVEDGPLFMAMELLRGPELSAVVRGVELSGRRVSQQEAIEIALPVLQSLAEAHKAGLVHRDLKPANIIIATMGDEHRVVKVLDFGIAHTQDSELTSEGQALGTPAYMSPEQVKGKSLDSRADLYSLGVILYRCLAGRPPFRADDSFALAFMHVQEEVPDLRGFCGPEVDDAMIAAVHRALSKDPDDRFQTAQEMHQALSQVADAARVRALLTAESAEGAPDPSTTPVSGMAGRGGSVLRALVEEAAWVGGGTPSAVQRAFRKSEDDATRDQDDDDDGAGNEPTAALSPDEQPLSDMAGAGAAAQESGPLTSTDPYAAGLAASSATPHTSLDATPHGQATMALDTANAATAAGPVAQGSATRLMVAAGAAALVAVGAVAWWSGRAQPPATPAAIPTPAASPAAVTVDANKVAAQALVAQVAQTGDLDAKIRLIERALQLAPDEAAYRVLLQTTREQQKALADQRLAEQEAARKLAQQQAALRELEAQKAAAERLAAEQAAARKTVNPPVAARKPPAAPGASAARQAKAPTEPAPKAAPAPTTPAPRPVAKPAKPREPAVPVMDF